MKIWGIDIVAFCLGNALKYICRWNNKDGIKDLKKAHWYLGRAIEELESRSNG